VRSDATSPTLEAISGHPPNPQRTFGYHRVGVLAGAPRGFTHMLAHDFRLTHTTVQVEV
jgi:Co/Zn/Cd efflux system component